MVSVAVAYLLYWCSGFVPCARPLVTATSTGEVMHEVLGRGLPVATHTVDVEGLHGPDQPPNPFKKVEVFALREVWRPIGPV